MTGPKQTDRCRPIDGRYLTLEDGRRRLSTPVKRLSSLEKIGLTFVAAMFAFILLAVFS